MRKNIKLIIGIVIGMIVVSGVSVYATLSYEAKYISYTKEGTNTEISVESALNELYKNKKETSDTTKEITSNGEQTLDKYYKNINVNVTTDKKYTQEEYDAKTIATTKTLLWTNDDPNSSMGSSDVNLNDSLTNYTHILIQWKANTSSTTIYDDIFKILPYRSNILEEGNLYTIGIENSDADITYIRYLRYKSDTVMRFPGVRMIGNGTEKDSKCIPVSIYGLNFTY